MSSNSFTKKSFYLPDAPLSSAQTLNWIISFNLNRILIKFSEDIHIHMDVVSKKIKKIWNDFTSWENGTPWIDTWLEINFTLPPTE